MRLFALIFKPYKRMHYCKFNFCSVVLSLFFFAISNLWGGFLSFFLYYVRPRLSSLFSLVCGQS